MFLRFHTRLCGQEAVGEIRSGNAKTPIITDEKHWETELCRYRMHFVGAVSRCFSSVIIGVFALPHPTVREHWVTAQFRFPGPFVGNYRCFCVSTPDCAGNKQWKRKNLDNYRRKALGNGIVRSPSAFYRSRFLMLFVPEPNLFCR